jgi:23S rRNA (adenine2503-C2)-methyltransferase
MTNLSKAHRALLDQHFKINHTNIAKVQISEDGTIKNAVRFMTTRWWNLF